MVRAHATLRLLHHDASQRQLPVDLELHVGGAGAVGVEQHIVEEEEHALLVALARQLLQAALAQELTARLHQVVNAH